MERDHVHIALGDQNGSRFRRRLARERPSIEIVALMEERGIRRIEIFRLPVAHDASAEGYDAAAPVGDREHHPAAEPVEGVAALLGLDQKSCLDGQRLPCGPFQAFI